jgi:hypothetical protein
MLGAYATVDERLWANGPLRERMLADAKSEWFAIDRLLAELTEYENAIGQ